MINPITMLAIWKECIIVEMSIRHTLWWWICDCINKAHLGIGDFIEIKDIKEQEL